MDISSITAAERVVDIKHPSSAEPIGLRITILPESDQRVVAVRRKFLNERLQRGHKVTAEKLAAQQTSIICAAVSGWDWQGELNFHGEKPEFSEQALRQVMAELSWIKDQLDNELGDEAAFYQG